MDLTLDLDHKGRCCDPGKGAGQERKRLGNVCPFHGPNDLLVGEQARMFTQTLTDGHCREDRVHNGDELGKKSAKVKTGHCGRASWNGSVPKPRAPTTHCSWPFQE